MTLGDDLANVKQIAVKLARDLTRKTAGIEDLNAFNSRSAFEHRRFKGGLPGMWLGTGS